MKKIQNTICTHLKSIFNLPKNTSGLRLLVVLGEPRVEIKLAYRLLLNWHKYKSHFGEYPELFREILEKYFEKNVLSDYSKLSKTFSEKLYDSKLKEMGAECQISLRDSHRDYLKRFWFTHPTNGDYLLIMFFTNTTQASNSRLFPICKCGGDNSARHCVDDCATIEINRVDYRNTYEIAYRSEGVDTDGFTLYDYLVYSFFTADLGEYRSHNRQRIIGLTKRIIVEVVQGRAKKEKTDL
jgi:hypothetical protein